MLYNCTVSKSAPPLLAPACLPHSMLAPVGGARPQACRRGRRAAAGGAPRCAAMPQPQQPPSSQAATPPVLLGRRGLLHLATCACCAQLGAARANEWTYGSTAASWPAVSKTCGLGSAQSPVDLDTAAVAAQTTRELSFAYAPRAATVLNTGHGTMQVNFAAGDATARVGTRKLQLLQFHFHTPSEHALDGNRLAMEAHLVHRDVDSGELAVVGTLLRADANAQPNTCLAAALRSGPPEPEAQAPSATPINPAALLPPPGKRSFLEYAGSLTTPPCSEQVTWIVFETPIAVPSSQVLAFMAYVGAREHTYAQNARPLQLLNGRTITRVVPANRGA